MSAVSSNAVSTVVGYLLDKDIPVITSANLPQCIAILGEANSDKQSGLSTDPVQITSAYQAGTLFGFGSPIHGVARILFPVSGGGVGVPVWVYPQEEAGGADANVQTITVSGTATAGVTHYVTVAGRDTIDGFSYAINISSGDSAATVAGKVRDAINNVLSCPMTATASSAVVTATAKWAGLTSQGITLAVNTNGNAAGLTYAIAEDTAGVGTPSVAAALTSFGNQWNTLVINTYGLVSATMTSLESFNGVPDPDNPTGRYAPTVWKPFVAISGSVSDDPSSTTDARKTQCTLAVAAAPLSTGLAYEAAANVAFLYADTANDHPERDIINRPYPDMPLPADGDIPLMASWSERDRIVKKGCSTADIVNGVYVVKDFVTTYHPVGENPPQYRFVRDLVGVDYNVYFAYSVLVNLYQLGKTVTTDDAQVNVEGVIRPKSWKAQIYDLIDSLVGKALLSDAAYSKNSLIVAIDGSNPNRMNTQFNYKRTGVTRISSNTVKAGFTTGN